MVRHRRWSVRTASPDRFKTCQRHQVDGRFRCLTTAGQHAASLEHAAGENVPRTDVKIGRFGAIASCRAPRSHALPAAGNTGGHALCCFNGHGKTGAVSAGIIFHSSLARSSCLRRSSVMHRAYNTATVTDGQRHLFLRSWFLPGKIISPLFHDLHRRSTITPASFTQAQTSACSPRSKGVPKECGV